MERITDVLYFVIPLFLLQLALLIVALVDLIRRKRTKGPKWVWVLVVLFVGIFGPIIYLLFGREEEDASDSD